MLEHNVPYPPEKYMIYMAAEVWYQEKGSLHVAYFEFPFHDHSFDSVFVDSVFTHMPIEETGNYLKHIDRVLSQQGQVLLARMTGRVHSSPLLVDQG